MAIGAMNIITDFIIMVMPLPLIWQLQLGKTQRAGLMLVFLTGALVWITTIVREVIVVKTDKEVDQSWSVADEIVWLTTELNVGIICICMPTLWPIWRQAVTTKMGFSYIHSLLSGILTKDSSQTKLSESRSASKDINVKREWSTHIIDGDTDNVSQEYILQSRENQIGLVNLRDGKKGANSSMV
ncbi:MAG: hypothetical protein Q9165_000697 [Trypethelium subeluteriae]